MKKYPLNEHAKAMMELGPEFFEPVWDDVQPDEDKRRTTSNKESDFADREGDLLILEETHRYGCLIKEAYLTLLSFSF